MVGCETKMEGIKVQNVASLGSGKCVISSVLIDFCFSNARSLACIFPPKLALNGICNSCNVRGVLDLKTRYKWDKCVFQRGNVSAHFTAHLTISYTFHIGH